MKQIQKCPHCRRDTMFSHDICPNCGYTSRPEERLEPDYVLYGREGGMPNYTAAMEEEMTVVQRHGAIQLGVSLGLLGFPPVSCLVTGLFLRLDPHRTMDVPLFWPLVLCVALGWCSWKLWHGERWVRVALCLYGLLPGLALLGLGVREVLAAETQPLMVVCGVVFGLMHLWSGWCLWKGRDLPEFLRFQQTRAERD